MIPMIPDKTYIEMCQEVKEFRNHEFEYGDYCYLDDGTLFIASGPLIDAVKNKATWLPLQHQLQEMIYNPINTNAVSAMFEEVSDFGLSFPYTDNSGETDGIDITSAEQLWLAFVMKEKYGKVWNGETWEEL